MVLFQDWVGIVQKNYNELVLQHESRDASCWTIAPSNDGKGFGMWLSGNRQRFTHFLILQLVSPRRSLHSYVRCYLRLSRVGRKRCWERAHCGAHEAERYFVTPWRGNRCFWCPDISNRFNQRMKDRPQLALTCLFDVTRGTVNECWFRPRQPK